MRDPIEEAELQMQAVEAAERHVRQVLAVRQAVGGLVAKRGIPPGCVAEGAVLAVIDLLVAEGRSLDEAAAFLHGFATAVEQGEQVVAGHA